jgi:Fe-Mn family superoxide dismutase
MNSLSRRDFVFLSSGAAIGNMVVPGAASAADTADAEPGVDFSHSGLVTGQPKSLRHAEIPGFLSAEQIAPHHTAHYGGALRGYTSADARLEEAARTGETIDPAAYGALKRAVNSKGNSVVLHELYFDGMTPDAPDPVEDVRAAIEQRFGSLEKWSDDFAASAKAAAGWAMLVQHPVNGKLYNVVSDEHAMGVLWMAVPLVVIDTYEHAFYIDYQNRKADYVEKFLDHINWDEADARYRMLGT